MKTIKPQKLGILCKPFENGDACYFTVSVLVFFPFTSPSLPLSEVEMWKFAAGELGDEPLDMGMPKQHGEVLLTGSAYTVGGPQPACAPRLAIHGIDKTLYVVGDRSWKRGVATDPKPFTEMPLRYDRAFGGEGFALNPTGKGMPPKTSDAAHALPNIEHPKRLIRSPSDHPEPAGFGPYELTWPQRFSKAGTYDASWLKERFPGFAKDMDWRIFNAAPEDQQIIGYFRGDEPFTIEHMHPEKPLLEGRLPSLCARAFITQRTRGAERFLEIPTDLDTVRLFPASERGILIFRGTVEIAEDDAADVVHLLIACESLTDPKPFDHYREVLTQRLDKKTGAFLALRDRDLMPVEESVAADAKPFQGETDETSALMSKEGLLRRNLRRRSEVEREKAYQRMVELGADPSKIDLPPIPADDPLPSLEEVPSTVEEMLKEAEQKKLQAEKEKHAAEEKLRALCATQGLDYDRVMSDAQAQAAGPPKFSAAEEMRKLRELAREANEHGVPCPELGQVLADPGLEERLMATEKALNEVYRRAAHYLPAAARLDDAARMRSRNEVAASYAAHRSFGGMD